MAHDPTRAWPLGIGPDQTAIPGAAWLELLDGQAFPVVGAGAMVRDGNAWTPASSSNPLHTRDAVLASLIGALNAAKETNPDAASASMLALLRGMLATFGKETTLAAVKAALDAISGKIATEASLAQAVQKLTALLERLDQKLTVEGEVQLKGQIAEFAVSSWEEIAPNEVPKGSLAILIGTDDIRQTDGQEWIPL